MPIVIFTGLLGFIKEATRMSVEYYVVLPLKKFYFEYFHKLMLEKRNWMLQFFSSKVSKLIKPHQFLEKNKSIKPEHVNDI